MSKQNVLHSIFYYYLNPAWRREEDKEYRKHSFSVVLFLCKKLLKGFFNFKRQNIFRSYSSIKSKNFVFADTLNQLYAFQSLKMDLSISSLFTISKVEEFATFGLSFGRLKKAELDVFQVLAFSRLFFSTLFEASRENKKVLINRAIPLYNFYSFYQTLNKAFESYSPKRIILFNDHMPLYRGILEAAKKQGVETVYVPHGSVSDKFPALDFDFAWLESQAMADTYTKCGKTKTKVSILGCKKYMDMAENSRLELSENIYGISLNRHMHDSDVSLYLQTLRESGVKYIVRPHPQLPLKEFKSNFGINEKVEVSDPVVETPLNFLSRISVLIGPASNMFLEAALCKVKGIQIMIPGDLLNDNYGFIEKGLVLQTINSPQELIPFLKGEKEVQFPEKSVVEYFSGPIDLEGFDNALQRVDSFR